MAGCDVLCQFLVLGPASLSAADSNLKGGGGEWLQTGWDSCSSVFA